MGQKPRTLPAPRVKYYVGEPVMVLPLAKYQRMIEHLSKMSRYNSEPQNIQKGLIQRNALILREGRDDIKAAKRYYHIDGQKPDPEHFDQNTDHAELLS